MAKSAPEDQIITTVKPRTPLVIAGEFLQKAVNFLKSRLPKNINRRTLLVVLLGGIFLFGSILGGVYLLNKPTKKEEKQSNYVYPTGTSSHYLLGNVISYDSATRKIAVDGLDEKQVSFYYEGTLEENVEVLLINYRFSDAEKISTSKSDLSIVKQGARVSLYGEKSFSANAEETVKIVKIEVYKGQ